MSLHVIILAAGQGTRMKSALPKVLHSLAGQPMLAYVIDTARQLSPACIHIVYGHGGDAVKTVFDSPDIVWVYQEYQHGTGHAVQLALEGRINPQDRICVMYGDVPLLSVNTVDNLLKATDILGVLTANINDTKCYGIIIRDTVGRVVSIIE